MGGEGSGGGVRQLDNYRDSFSFSYGYCCLAFEFKFFVPGLDLVGTDRNVGDSELAVMFSHCGILIFSNDNPAGHLRVDFAEQVNHTRLIEGDRPCDTRIIGVKAEFIALTCRSDIMIDFVVVRKINCRTDRYRYYFRNKSQIKLINGFMLWCNLLIDAFQINDCISFVFRQVSFNGTGDCSIAICIRCDASEA